MSIEIFRLQLILRNLEKEVDISLEEKIWLVNAILGLPNQTEWSKFVQAAIYEAETDKLLELMHTSNITPLLLEDISNIVPDYSLPIQLLVKIARAINSFDTKYGMVILKYCHDDRECEPSLIRYLNRQATYPEKQTKECITLPNTEMALVSHVRQKAIPQTQKLHSELQKIIDNATIKREFVCSNLSDFKINPYIADAERYASNNIEMIDDELRDLFKMSQIFGQANYLCQQPLV